MNDLLPILVENLFDFFNEAEIILKKDIVMMLSKMCSDLSLIALNTAAGVCIADENDDGGTCAEDREETDILENTPTDDKHTRIADSGAENFEDIEDEDQVQAESVQPEYARKYINLILNFLIKAATESVCVTDAPKGLNRPRHRRLSVTDMYNEDTQLYLLCCYLLFKITFQNEVPPVPLFDTDSDDVYADGNTSMCETSISSPMHTGTQRGNYNSVNNLYENNYNKTDEAHSGMDIFLKMKEIVKLCPPSCADTQTETDVLSDADTLINTLTTHTQYTQTHASVGNTQTHTNAHRHTRSCAALWMTQLACVDGDMHTHILQQITTCLRHFETLTCEIEHTFFDDEVSQHLMLLGNISVILRCADLGVDEFVHTPHCGVEYELDDICNMSSEISEDADINTQQPSSPRSDIYTNTESTKVLKYNKLIGISKQILHTTWDVLNTCDMGLKHPRVQASCLYVLRCLCSASYTTCRHVMIGADQNEDEDYNQTYTSHNKIYTHDALTSKKLISHLYECMLAYLSGYGDNSTPSNSHERRYSCLLPTQLHLRRWCAMEAATIIMCMLMQRDSAYLYTQGVNRKTDVHKSISAPNSPALSITPSNTDALQTKPTDEALNLILKSIAPLCGSEEPSIELAKALSGTLGLWVSTQLSSSSDMDFATDTHCTRTSRNPMSTAATAEAQCASILSQCLPECLTLLDMEDALPALMNVLETAAAPLYTRFNSYKTMADTIDMLHDFDDWIKHTYAE